MRGPVLDEVHQQLNPWVSQVIYLFMQHLLQEYFLMKKYSCSNLF